MKKAMKQSVALLMMMVSFLQAPLLVQAAEVAPARKPASEYSSPGARDVIQEIIDVVGLKPRFEVREGNVENAAAVVYGGQRYILYNRQFMAAINNATKTDWAAISILAHEIGHHLNGHTLSRSGSNPADELEADEFSGFVLRKMGASLQDAQAAINLLSNERGSHTHPGRSNRLASISKGWKSADNQVVTGATAGIKARPVITQRGEQTVASAPVRQSQTTPVQRTASRVVLNEQYILRKVTFRSVPNETFFLTTRMNLVHVDDNGKVEIIGKMAQTNSRNYPFVLQSSYFDAVFVNNSGYLVTQDGQRVGHLS